MKRARRHWLGQWGAPALLGLAPPGVFASPATGKRDASRAPEASPPQQEPQQGPHPALLAGTPLRFPHDHGAHPATRTEWWYLTGEMAPAEAGSPPLGFQITFFRTRVDSALGNPSRFAVRHLLLAHAAISDPQRGRLLHDQRVARTGFGLVGAAEGDARLALRDWTLARGGPAGAPDTWHARIPARDFRLTLRVTPTQPPLIQGEQGFSRKASSARYATRYYSMPQLDVAGALMLRGRETAVRGRAWLDHEWGETLLAPGVVGWDWIGINLRDGGALMVFQTRAEDGSAAWRAATLRRPGQPDRHYASAEIRMTPQRTWQSPATAARYPIAWHIELAGMRLSLHSRMPNQELDALHSTGNIYWEGLCDLHDPQGRIMGTGYLEMTGYAAPMSL